MNPEKTPERILYVDDEREAREAFASAAQQLGYRVDTADGGGEALTKASRHQYAVIATDLRMPTLNGLSLIQLLRPKWPLASYLIVTGASHVDLPPQHNGDPLVDEVLDKPWNLHDLARILSRAIDRYRSRRASSLELASSDGPLLLLSEGSERDQLFGALRSACPEILLLQATTIDRALTLLGETGFRAAVLDLDRAPGGGLGLLGRIREAQPNLPLVVLGAREDDDLRQRTLQAGASDYLPKPAICRNALRQSLRYAAERQRIDNHLRFLMQRDPVSNLFNRSLFQERLEQGVRDAGRTSSGLAVLLLDLDRFETVNDSLGHGIGDRLLQLVAERIRENLRETDLAARLGGDKFAVLLQNVRSEEEALGTAQRLLEALVPPARLDEYEIVVTGSIGIALYPEHGESAGELLQRADRAVYRAKQSGRDNCEMASNTTEESRSGVLERLRFESGVRYALERKEYVLCYQPQMTMDRSRLLAVEALIRWNHPKAGMVPPGEFMPFLESTGLIKGVGAWVLETACSEVREWQERGFVDLRLTVNLSARQFEGSDLVGVVDRILRDTGLPPSRLELEITESLLMTDIARTRAILHELKSLGVRIAIDDFGTGYSSLAYLTKFPLDCLKIDRSFVRDIENDADDRAVADAIIGLGHTLRLDVVAEGVETEPQLALLQGCDGFQGYLISKPQPAAETFAFLEHHRGS